MDEGPMILTLDQARMRNRPWMVALRNKPAPYLFGLILIFVGIVLVLSSYLGLFNASPFLSTVALAGGVAAILLTFLDARDELDVRSNQEVWLQDGCLLYSYHAPRTDSRSRVAVCVDLGDPQVEITSNSLTMTVIVSGPTVSVETEEGATDVQLDVFGAPISETVLPDCFLPPIADVLSDVAGVEVRHIEKKGR